MVTIVGGGLAGSEAAWQLGCRGVFVHLIEMRPEHMTPVHRTGGLAELVCSNSLKSMRADSAAGMLKRELASLGSMVLSCALQTKVPAGGALAVDRNRFSQLVTRKVQSHHLISVERSEAVSVPGGRCIIAAGPVVSDALAREVAALVGGESLAFFDAAAPIIDAASIDHGKVFAQSRYGKGGDDYLNAPFDRTEYEAFVAELVAADRVILRDFERGELFSACKPVEEIARTGLNALRYGALKPVGLCDPHTGRRPWAAVQLRKENAEGTAYNLVGFQTNLTWPEQARVFRMVPGLEQAEFLRFGVMHRNTFVNSPHVLDATFALPARRSLRFAGQITGTEGYCEAIASGLLAALNTYADIEGLPEARLPRETALGALLSYATDPHTKGYQPMHVNFGLMPPLGKPVRNKRDRYGAYARRGAAAMGAWTSSRLDLHLLPFEGGCDALGA